MPRLTTAVVICAYTLDRWDDLSAAVASAAHQDPPPDELVLVVDHNDLLLQKANDELPGRHAGLQIIPNTRKQGLSGARNTAVEHVAADVVVFLDDDATADDGWLALLVEPFTDAAVIAVGGSADPRWSDGEARPATLPTAGADHWGELDWVVGCSYAGQPVTTAPLRNVMGCNMSFRRDVFAEVGGFSEDLGRVGKVPLGCEETELCIRAAAARDGSRILFQPSARVRHHVSTDRLTWHYLLRRCYAEGLSKAAVSAMVGQDRALATERGYVTKVLPRGLVRELARAVTRRSAVSAASSLAIIAGLTATVLGYGRGRAAQPETLGRGVPQLQLQAPTGLTR